MTEISASDDNQIDRSSTCYCYICNTQTTIRSSKADRKAYLDSKADYCFKNLVQRKHLEFNPLLCTKQSCKDAYENLLPAHYAEARVPLRTEVRSDGKGFLGFAKRNKRPEIRDQDDPINPVHLEFLGNNAHKLEPLYQAWLFFEFCQDFLGEYFIEDHYIYADGDGGFSVTLEPLHAAVTTWMQTLPRSGQESEYILLRYSRAAHILLRLLSPASIWSSFSDDLRVFIFSAAELVSIALDFAFPERDIKRIHRTLWPDSRIDRFKELGWCPYEAYSFVKSAYASATLALHSKINRRQRGSLHLDCKRSKCTQSQKQRQIQRGPGHRADCTDQECKSIYVDEDMMTLMCSLIRNEQFPGLKIHVDNMGKAVSIEFAPCEQGMEYIAISHVWADGMGNEDDNSLNQCHLTRLHDVACELTKIIHPGTRSSPLLLWIDTICCPVVRRCGSVIKNEALKLLLPIYKHATAALVIDAELELTPTMMVSPLEVGARTLVSTWVWRLWTLQEGALPFDLWFLFKDRILNSNTLFLAIRDKQRMLNIRDRITAQALLYSFLGIRILSTRYEGASPELTITTFFREIEKRRVTVAKDEAVCIANLLELDLARILQQDEAEERMMELWKMLGERNLIPRSIAFQSLDTLEAAGYSWALSTFLQPGSSDVFRRAQEPRVSMGKRGLIVPAAGIALVAIPQMKSIDIGYICGNTTWKPATDMVWFEVSKGSWRHLYDYVDNMAKDGKDETQPLLRSLLSQAGREFVLLPKYQKEDESAEGVPIYLLAEVVEESEEGTICKGHRVLQEAAMSRQMSQGQSWAVLQVEDMKARGVFSRVNSLSPLKAYDAEADERREAYLELLEHFKFDHSLAERIPASSKIGLETVDQDGNLDLDGLSLYHIFGVLDGNCAIAGKRYPEDHRWVLI